MCEIHRTIWCGFPSLENGLSSAPQSPGSLILSTLPSHAPRGGLAREFGRRAPARAGRPQGHQTGARPAPARAARARGCARSRGAPGRNPSAPIGRPRPTSHMVLLPGKESALEQQAALHAAGNNAMCNRQQTASRWTAGGSASAPAPVRPLLLLLLLLELSLRPPVKTYS